MKHSSRPRKTANLSESVHHQLSMYAIAAGAAGAGLLAWAQPAEARIIYTPTHRSIKNHDVFHLDLNHDRIDDFLISNHSFCTTDICGRTLPRTSGCGPQSSGWGQRDWRSFRCLRPQARYENRPPVAVLR
jgi:hypothetical protein